MLQFHHDMANKRLDSLGPDFEEYFDINQMSDDDDIANKSPFAIANGTPGSDKSNTPDFYNQRRNSKTSPDARG